MIRYIILIVTTALFLTNANGQFALETSYGHSLTVTKINDTEFKYYLMDVGRSECRIFNTDHTLWKTISIALPANYYLSDIKFVSQNMFNSDSNVELWYSAYNWVQVGTGTDGYYRYVSKVIDETGRNLATIDNGLYAYVINAGEANYKLAVYAYDNSFFPGSIKTYIYALPGTANASWHIKAALADPYPNPVSGIVNLPVTEGTLQVFSVSGQLLTEQKVINKSAHQINTNGWEPGVYSYRIISTDGVSELKRFIVK